MTGVFAGQILKGRFTGVRKIQYLVLIGVSMIIVGQLWSIQMPIIKKIWTSSMTLYSSGICFLLMALFYFLVDYKNYGKYLNWLKIYGMNSILAYMIYQLTNFSCITEPLLHGTEQFLGGYYPAFTKLASVSISFFILWIMHRNGKFLKV
jgi:predicted acyltransferase